MAQNETETNPTLVIDDLSKVRETKPLVCNITNFVVMQLTANALLALGASPIMSLSTIEIKELVSLSNSLVINIGTLDDNWLEIAKIACHCAADNNTPTVVDPVGAGATQYRTQSALALIKSLKNKIIRGNPAEIIALVGKQILSKGVDSQYISESALECGLELAAAHQCVVAITGSEDIIIAPDASSILRVQNDNPIMTKVTGMGCVATAIIGAFAAINPSAQLAATHALSTIGIAGELATQKSSGPASFQVEFLDHLFSLNGAEIEQRFNVRTSSQSDKLHRKMDNSRLANPL